MRKSSCVVLAAALSITLDGTAQIESSKPAAQKAKGVSQIRRVIVRFVDGSNVVMILNDDQLEIATKFGKLTVKPSDIREIQFGVHLTAELEREIMRALGELGSTTFRARQAAHAKLLKLGPYSYMILQKRKKQNDLESTRRIEKLLKEIEEKFEPEQLRTTEQDRIRTTEFVFTGRILSKVIAAQSQYFGKAELIPKDLLAIRWAEDTSRAEVTISAAEYGSQTRRWLKTNVRVDPKVPVTIRASGFVDLWPQGGGSYISTPDGYGAQAGIRIQPRLAPGTNMIPGALMGRIGESGTPFLIGSNYNERPKSAGRLYLMIGPSPWNNNSTGSYEVEIRSGGSGLFDED